MRRRVSLIAVLVAGVILAQQPSAWDLYQRGREAEKKGRMAEAYVLYSQAAAADPKNQNYWLRAQAVQSRAVMEAPPMPSAEVLADAAAQADSAQPIVLEPPTPDDLQEAGKPLPPTKLAAEDVRRDFDLKGDTKKIYEQVAKDYGLEVVFDGDYVALPSFRFQMQDVDYRTALHTLEATTGTFIVPITEKVFMVVADTPQKRADVEPQVAVAVHLSDVIAQQDFVQAVNAVQQTLMVERVAFDTSESTVILRGAISKVLAAQALLLDISRPRAQVQIEVKVAEVTLNDMLTYGVQLPTKIDFTSLVDTMHLLTKGLGKYFGIGLLDGSLVAQMTKNSGSVLMEASGRSVDGAPVTMNFGQKYPILTSGYFGPSGFDNGSAYRPIPSFTFEDLGLSVKITPAVHGMQEVTLDVDAKLKVLTGKSYNGIPVVANRSILSKVRVPFGEWTALAGLMETQEARSVAGLAGVSKIPYLGALTSVRTKTTSEHQVMMFLRPVLINIPPNETPARTFYMGSDSRPLTPL